MSTMNDFDRAASSWLATGPTELNDRVLEAALDEVHLTRQRRRRWVPWRFTNVPMITRTTVSAAAVLIAVIGVGGALYGAANPNGSGRNPTAMPASTPVPTPSPTALPTTTASPTASPTATAGSAFPALPRQGGALAAGTYRAGSPFMLPNLTFDVPTGWNEHSGLNVRVVSLVNDSSTQAGEHLAFVNFAVPDAVYADPCGTGTAVQVGDLGSTVDDFIAALSKLPKFTVGPVTDVLVDGLPGKAFDLTNSVQPSGTTCAGDGLIQVWRNGYDGVGGATLAGLRQHVVVVDVDGTRLVIEVLYADPTEPMPDVEAIISSVRFE
jgi:hypothetical protein